MPPLTAVITPSRVPYRFGSFTSTRSMIRHSGTTGPHTPWMTRPANSIGTLVASAATTQPTTISASIPASTLRRPITSPSRGRNSENSAAEVKNAVWVRPISAEVAPRLSSMLFSAGLSMLALSWKAKQATSSAVTRTPTRTPDPEPDPSVIPAGRSERETFIP